MPCSSISLWSFYHGRCWTCAHAKSGGYNGAPLLGVLNYIQSKISQWSCWQRFNRFWKHTYFIRSMHILRYVTGLGGVGDVNVHVNLRHMHILRYVTGLGGWGMLTLMLTCVTCTSYVTSLGWGGWGVLTFMLTSSHAHLTLRHWVGGGGGC